MLFPYNVYSALLIPAPPPPRPQRRYPTDPTVHTALGYFLLARDHNSNSGSNRNSNNGGGSDLSGQDDLERATTAFRRATRASRQENAFFVPAARGLAVAVRRRRLITPTVAGDALKNSKDGKRDEQVGEYCGAERAYTGRGLWRCCLVVSRPSVVPLAFTNLSWRLQSYCFYVCVYTCIYQSPRGVDERGGREPPQSPSARSPSAFKCTYAATRGGCWCWCWWRRRRKRKCGPVSHHRPSSVRLEG